MSSRLERVAERVASECEALAHGTDALQAEMGQWIEAGGIELDGEAIMRLQETDRIAQTLRCMARLMHKVAPLLTELETDRESLEAEVGLESVARRLLAD